MTTSCRRRRAPRSRSRSTRCCGCSRRTCPFVTEEVWSWWRTTARCTARRGRVVDDLPAFAATTSRCIRRAAAVLGEMRKAKSEAKRSMRTDVTHARRATRRPSSGVRSTPAIDDVRDAGRVVGELELRRRRGARGRRHPREPRSARGRVTIDPRRRPRLARRPRQPRDRRRGAGAGPPVGKRLLAVERERPLMRAAGLARSSSTR